MKIDELIKELEKIKEEHGNLNIVIYHRFDERDSYLNDDYIELMVDEDKKLIYL